MERTMARGGPAGARRVRGFTLLEVVIAGTILVLIVALAARTLAAGNALLGAVTKEASGDVLAQQLVTQIANRIRNGIISEVEYGSLGGNAYMTDPSYNYYYGLKVRMLKSFDLDPTHPTVSGGMDRGKTVWISAHISDPYTPGGLPYAFDRTDNDGDGLIDEGMLRLREFPGDDDAAGATFTDYGILADNVGLIYTTSAPPGEPLGFDPRGIWDPDDPAYTRYVFPGLFVERRGDTLLLTVGVLRRDPQVLGKLRKPVIRCYMAKASVTLRN